MKKLLLLLMLVVPCSAWASDTNWTEVDVTVFDEIDGDFAPRLTGAVINFVDGKGIGAFLGPDNAIGPLLMWDVWHLDIPGWRFAIFTLASTDVSGTVEGETLFRNGTFGLEPRIRWKDAGNVDVALGVLNWKFAEGQKASWGGYIKLVFQP